MKVAIAGATGLTGGIAFAHLLNHASVSEVISIGRRPSGVRHPKLKEVELVEGELPHPVQADAWICALGTTLKKAGSKDAFRAVDLDLPLKLAQSLFVQGCRTAAVVSAMGADADSRVFYNRIKGEMEEGMKTIGFSSLTLLRPSLIIGDRQENRPAEKLAMTASKVLGPFMVGGLAHYRGVDAKSIGRRLVDAALTAKPGLWLELSDDIRRNAEAGISP